MLSLTFAIIAGIMALDSSGGKCQQGPVVKAFNGAPVYVEASHAWDDAISFLANCNAAVGEAAHAQPAWHKPITCTSSFLKLNIAATFAVLYDDVSVDSR
jgi:hypothetical protein